MERYVCLFCILLFDDVCYVHLHRAFLIIWNTSNYILCLWDRLIVEHWSACGTFVMCLRQCLQIDLVVLSVCLLRACHVLAMYVCHLLAVTFCSACRMLSHLLLLLGIHLLNI